MKYPNLIASLKNIANYLDGEGQFKSADVLDYAMRVIYAVQFNDVDHVVDYAKQHRADEDGKQLIDALKENWASVTDNTMENLDKLIRNKTQGKHSLKLFGDGSREHVPKKNQWDPDTWRAKEPDKPLDDNTVRRLAATPYAKLQHDPNLRYEYQWVHLLERMMSMNLDFDDPEANQYALHMTLNSSRIYVPAQFMTIAKFFHEKGHRINDEDASYMLWTAGLRGGLDFFKSMFDLGYTMKTDSLHEMVRTLARPYEFDSFSNHRQSPEQVNEFFLWLLDNGYIPDAQHKGFDVTRELDREGNWTCGAMLRFAKMYADKKGDDTLLRRMQKVVPVEQAPYGKNKGRWAPPKKELGGSAMDPLPKGAKVRYRGSADFIDKNKVYFVGKRINSRSSVDGYKYDLVDDSGHIVAMNVRRQSVDVLG